MSEKGPSASSNPELGEYKQSVVFLVLGFFMFLSAVYLHYH